MGSVSCICTGTTKVFNTEIMTVAPGSDYASGSLDPVELALAQKRLSEQHDPEPDIQEIRSSMVPMSIPLHRTALKTIDLLMESGGRQIRMKACIPPSASRTDPVASVLYLHAGSWFAGSTAMCENTCRLLAERSSSAVFNLDYSLAPEYPYPCAVEDCLCAVEYLSEASGHLPVDPAKMIIAGESCAGQIILSALLKLSQERPGFIRDHILLCGLFYPCVLMDIRNAPFTWSERDFVMRDEFRDLILPRLALGSPSAECSVQFMEKICAMYLQHGESLSDPCISPLNIRNPAFLPDLFVATAEFDGLRQQGEYFVSRARASGISVDAFRYLGVHHSFLDKLGILKQAEDCVTRFADRIRSCWT